MKFFSLPTYDGVNPSMLLKLFPDYGESLVDAKLVALSDMTIECDASITECSVRGVILSLRLIQTDFMCRV